MQTTHQVHAMALPEYWWAPHPDHMPIIVTDEDLKNYLGNGWAQVGTATVTVEYFDEERIRAMKMDALQAQLKTVRGENAILDQISKLQALTYERA
jgi:hypothetical protein